MIKLNKKLVLIALIFVLIIATMNSVYAILNPDEFDPEADKLSKDNNNKFSGIISEILKIIRAFGIIVAVVGVMIIGIQTMLASAEEKAVYKQKVMPLIIGVFLLLATITVVSMLWKISTGKGIYENPSPYEPGPIDEPM